MDRLALFRAAKPLALDAGDHAGRTRSLDIGDGKKKVPFTLPTRTSAPFVINRGAGSSGRISSVAAPDRRRCFALLKIFRK
jgi:hypothetical protein